MFECSTNKGSNKYDLMIAELSKELKILKTDTTAKLLIQDGKIAETVVYIKNNLSDYLREMLNAMNFTDEVDKIIKEMLVPELMLLDNLKFIVTPQMFGDVGCGCDDTKIIQKAIDEANKKGRVLFIPKGKYKISASLILNGCTIIGEPGNIFNEEGTVIECTSKDFTAFKQGSTATTDIMFNLKNIIVKNADVAFEIVYSINSTFERLYAVDCNIGFKLGSPESVGSMFCEFNNLYTDKCLIGINISSSQYFNNNRFNNGFIQGSDKAMVLNVVGGYGAVDNTFNNVEFRSATGRGIEISNAPNTTFNSCYFECGGNVLRTKSYCTITLNNCVYGLFNPDNKYSDVNMIYSEGGSAFTFNDGTIFLNDNYTDRIFFNTGNTATYQNIVVIKTIRKNGSAEGFVFFNQNVKTIAYEKEEQVTITGTVTIDVNSDIEVPFTYATPFSSIPNVTVCTIRGENGRGIHTIISERTREGGKLKVSNTGNSARSVSFSIYAKLL